MKTIYTIGHSNLDIEPFIDLLKHYKIECIADVRRYPSSTRFPQFNKGNLIKGEELSDIEYFWLGEQLGGRREVEYEKYIQTNAFQQGFRALKEIAEVRTTAILCAEKNYLDCHRKFIADVFVRSGWDVVHIIDEKRWYDHQQLSLF